MLLLAVMSLFDLFHVFIKVLYCCFCMGCDCLMIKAILGSARLLGTRHYGFCSLDLVDWFFYALEGRFPARGHLGFDYRKGVFTEGF